MEGMSQRSKNMWLVFNARHANLQGVEEDLEAGADIDFEQPDSGTNTKTALFAACANGDLDMVRLLLRKGASVSKRIKCSCAPLHAAASAGLTKTAELLVNAGATLDIRDCLQFTPLMRACAYKQVDTVRRLIELGARVDLTDDYCQIAQRFGTEVGCRHWEECMKLIQEARKSRLLRCCNPKCGKPGYRSTGALKLCGRCKMTRYCSRDCQKQHWSVGHKKCCGHDAYPVDV
ncbi:ankyrin repeat and EF-hand domain-containing protein 1-like isoform X2 [Branchiostoma lanceolatum]|uniref:ankyrin repeat and EF-hand domain-containing protein 1-like isoform X2 n=1 Tax=Branchiostoma lanceolatum TaxID=7740 RepID=UPI003452CE59